ncbi:MAG TPA: HD domain-containing protein [archaeon]|nr:HD domain-containing protein [archaeon]
MDNLIKFFLEVGKLKGLERSGWVIEGVKNPESVAEHIFRTALAVIVLGKDRKDMDLHKAVKMALVHDIAESQVGDILVDWKLKLHSKENVSRLRDLEKHGIAQEEKLRREKEGMEKLVSLLGKDGKEFLDLWEEFEEGKSKEAAFVKSVETFEMFLQAYQYKKEQPGVDISAWFGHRRDLGAVKDDKIKKLILKIVEQRNSKK